MWQKFCEATGKEHKTSEHGKFCGSCGKANPSYAASRPLADKVSESPTASQQRDHALMPPPAPIKSPPAFTSNAERHRQHAFSSARARQLANAGGRVIQQRATSLPAAAPASESTSNSQAASASQRVIEAPVPRGAEIHIYLSAWKVDLRISVVNNTNKYTYGDNDLIGEWDYHAYERNINKLLLLDRSNRSVWLMNFLVS